jgi:hypothetical protein
MISEANFYTSFVKPFVDVFTTAKLASIRTLSAFWMAFLNMFFTLRPRVMKERIEAHKKRTDGVERKWQRLMSDIDSGMSVGGGAFFLMLYAPTLWASKFTINWTVDNVDKVKNFIEGEGFSLNREEKKSNRRDGDFAKKPKNVYDKLLNLFFEGSSSNSNVLVENKTEFSQLDTVFGSNEFKAMTENVTESLIVLLRPIATEYELCKKLAAVTNVEEFNAAVDQARNKSNESETLKLMAENLTRLKNEIEQESHKMSNDKELVRNYVIAVVSHQTNAEVNTKQITDDIINNNIGSARLFFQNQLLKEQFPTFKKFLAIEKDILDTEEFEFLEELSVIEGLPSELDRLVKSLK